MRKNSNKVYNTKTNYYNYNVDKRIKSLSYIKEIRK